MSEVSGPTQGLMNIEEDARPPFAVLPDSSALFPSRSKRLAALEALEDDVASLGLDMLLAGEGWKRGDQNPFLLGY